MSGPRLAERSTLRRRIKDGPGSLPGLFYFRCLLYEGIDKLVTLAIPSTSTLLISTSSW
jgi:hypothetical protein